MRRNINDWERAVSIGAGFVALAFALQPRAHRRTAAVAGAAALIARGLGGYCPFSAAAGRHRGIANPDKLLSHARAVDVAESVTIQATPHVLFSFLRDPSNVLAITPQVVDVDVHNRRAARWTIRGLGGRKLSWDAELTREIADELIEWRARPWGDVACEGSVRFYPVARGGTEVHVVLRYAPPGGRAGTAAAWLSGRSPASDIREALRRLKQLVETGEWPSVTGQSSGQRSTRFRLMKAAL